MNKIFISLFFMVFMAAGIASHAADDPSIQGKPRDGSQTAMTNHINSNTFDGKYVIYDAVTGKLLKLDFKKLHAGLVKKGDFYVSCADFADTEGNKYDLDFLVGEKNDDYFVVQALVHKVNTDKRKYHIED
ncbi:MAG: hypothetical protein GWO07_01185 [Candidatus Dadabacteria bacterium]|nr:hypothetical protein [Candidatus Dadabacteria bacterium]NIV41349.1 hypothetical protein [Candidatus Dadabacteria bacterium]NIX14560.1 hypothetical protein [Candidatus Dadabacteria bacterium]